MRYVDGFVLPLPKERIADYEAIAKTASEIWKEHGALAYFEYVGEDLNLEGTRSFIDAVNAQADEAIVFGWVVFESKQARDQANKRVPEDPRMKDIIAPLINPSSLIFDASRMVYGGFESLVQ